MLNALNAAGFRAQFQPPGELFGGLQERSAVLVALDSAP
jgi:hypothetical protein